MNSNSAIYNTGAFLNTANADENLGSVLFASVFITCWNSAANDKCADHFNIFFGINPPRDGTTWVGLGSYAGWESTYNSFMAPTNNNSVTTDSKYVGITFHGKIYVFNKFIQIYEFI